MHTLACMYVYYEHSRLRCGIVAFDGTAILVELRWKCAPSTPFRPSSSYTLSSPPRRSVVFRTGDFSSPNYNAGESGNVALRPYLTCWLKKFRILKYEN